MCQKISIFTPSIVSYSFLYIFSFFNDAKNFLHMNCHMDILTCSYFLLFCFSPAYPGIRYLNIDILYLNGRLVLLLFLVSLLHFPMHSLLAVYQFSFLFRNLSQPFNSSIYVHTSLLSQSNLLKQSRVHSLLHMRHHFKIQRLIPAFFYCLKIQISGFMLRYLYNEVDLWRLKH